MGSRPDADDLHEINLQLVADLTALDRRLAADAAQLRELKSANERLVRRVEELERALEPRLRTIATLRPIRYVLAERNRLARGRQSSAYGPNGGDALGAGKPTIPDKKAEATPETLVASVRRAADEAGAPASSAREPGLAVAVFCHDRARCAVNVIEALARQGGLDRVHVWIDGDQGNPAKQGAVDFLHACVAQYPVAEIRRNRGNFGFRKMVLTAMRHMSERYDRVLYLEDDCFPTRNALSGFAEALDATRSDPSIFSVYGHPFLIEGEEAGTARFQGWGWAAWSDRLQAVWPELLDCYLMTEEEYLGFVANALTPELEAAIDVTPNRQPSATLKRFFAWDETLCLLTARRGLRHRPTAERTIYNFGAGTSSTHFRSIEYFRKPPFNMVAEDELWPLF